MPLGLAGRLVSDKFAGGRWEKMVAERISALKIDVQAVPFESLERSLAQCRNIDNI
jgi:hypothetical protein